MRDIIIDADISKDHIDLHRLPDDDRLHVANDRKGFAAILKWIGTRTGEGCFRPIASSNQNANTGLRSPARLEPKTPIE